MASNLPAFSPPLASTISIKQELFDLSDAETYGLACGYLSESECSTVDSDSDLDRPLAPRLARIFARHLEHDNVLDDGSEAASDGISLSVEPVPCDQHASKIERVDIRAWQSVGTGLASVFAAEIVAFDRDQKMSQIESVNVQAWQSVGTGLASVFAAEMVANRDWQSVGERLA